MSVSMYLNYRTLTLGKVISSPSQQFLWMLVGHAVPSPDTVTIPAYKDGQALVRLRLLNSSDTGSGNKSVRAESCCSVGELGTCVCEVAC